MTIARRSKPAFKCLAMILLALILFAGSATHEALAGRGWCSSDPVVLIDGQLADVYVTSDLAMLTSANGPIKMVIEVPDGSSASLVLTDLGFGYGYAISFVHSSDLVRSGGHTPVRVSVYAPARKSTLDVHVIFAPRALNAGLTAILFGSSADGSANMWTSLTAAA